MYARISPCVSLTLALAFFSPPKAAQLPDTLLVIQAEPDTATPATFQALRNLVAAADARNLHLTLEFSPQWASMILASPSLQADLDTWRNNGHEIGAHHHDAFGPLVWDGYTDLDPAMVAPLGPYLGTMADFKALLDQLVPGAGVQTGGIGGSAFELPFGLPFLTRGPAAVSQPLAEVHNRYGVWTLTFQGLADITQVAGLVAAHSAAGTGDVVGVGTHVFNFASKPGPLTAWMNYLATVDPEGTTSRTASEILSDLPPSLEVAPSALSASTGGSIAINLRTAPALAGADYFLAASLGGSSPGIDVGGSWNDSVHVALNPDALTTTSLALAGSPWFAGFAGTLGANGEAMATLNTLGPLPAALVGTPISMTFVAADAGGLLFSSSPVEVVIDP